MRYGWVPALRDEAIASILGPRAESTRACAGTSRSSRMSR